MNSTGKQILLSSAYRDVRSDLGPLRQVNPDGRFFEMILDVFDEFAEHEVNLAALQGALESAALSLSQSDQPFRRQAGTSLLGKLRDLCTLYVRYRALLEERNFFDPAFNLTEAASTVHQVPWIADAHFAVDGFTSFTHQQIRLVSAIATAGGKVIVIGDRDGSASDAGVGGGHPHEAQSSFPRLQDYALQAGEKVGSLWLGSEYQFAQLSAVLQRAGVAIEVRRFNQPRRFAHSDLLALETAIREGKSLPVRREDAGVTAGVDHGQPPSVPGAGVSLWACRDEETEFRQVAKAITALVELERVRFSDIAVVCPSIEDEGLRLSEIFDEQQIPYAIDTFPKLSAHPLGRFLGAAMKLARDDMSVDAAAAFIRTDYVQLSLAERDRLDLYLRQYGVQGADVWQASEPWAFAGRTRQSEATSEVAPEDQFADKLRRRLYARLEPFLAAAGQAAITPIQLAQAVWGLFEAFDVRAQVAISVVREDPEVNPLVASQEEQAWSQIVALLNDLATVHPDLPLDRLDALRLVLEALDRERLSTIPSGVNQVFLCDFQHAKNWTKPHVFVIGANDTTIPLRARASGLLQDDEREMFSHIFGTPLGWTERETFLLLQAVPYRILTRARERLVVSYAKFVHGAERRPAQLLTYLSELLNRSFDHIEPEAIGPAHAADQSLPILRPRQALTLLVQTLASITSAEGADEILRVPLVQDILEYLLHPQQDEGVAAAWSQGLRGLGHRLPNGRIPEPIATALFGSPLKTSVNRLESYAACPYAFFLRHGLRIEPIAFDDVRPQDIGNLLHDVVYAMVEELSQQDVAHLSMEDVQRLVRDKFEEVLHRPLYRAMDADALRRIRSRDLARYVDVVGEILWRQMERSQFRPHALEWSFGLGEDDMPAFRIEGDDGSEIELRGRVDRVDVFETEHVRWYRIFDYKTRSGQRLDPTNIYYGLQLQLLAYAAVVGQLLSDDKPALPAGVYYMPLVTQPDLLDGPLDASKAHDDVLKVYRAEGYMAADDAVIAAMDADLPRRQSMLFKEVYKQDGSLLKTAKVWTAKEWSNVLEAVQARIKKLAADIKTGKVPVRPYLRQRADRACNFCSYNSICQFEHGLHATHYRVLRSRRFDELFDARETWRDQGEEANTR